MKDELPNEPKELTPAVRQRMEKSFFGSVILKERGLTFEKEKENNGHDAKTSDTV